MNMNNRAKRTCWRQEEKAILKVSFENNPNPDAIELNRLAQVVNKDTDVLWNKVKWITAILITASSFDSCIA